MLILDTELASSRTSRAARHLPAYDKKMAEMVGSSQSSLMKITDSTRKMDRASRERYNIFLGGSCGGRTSPTTWRKEVAIPILTKNAVTFYNPQVETWSQELLNKEDNAKENSDWLLFMLESSTRGMSSLVEVAYSVGKGRSVLFIMQEEREQGQFSIKDDHITQLECEDIMASQQALSTLISRHECCQYFSVLEKGLNHVIDGIKTAEGVTQNGNSYSGKGEKNKLWSDWVQKILMFIGKRKTDDKKARRPTSLKISPLQRYTIGVIGADSPANLTQLVNDRLHNLRKDSVYVAQGNSTQVVNTLMQCSLVLVIIPENSLASPAMCKAAYLLSRHKNIVLSVESITATSVDNGNTKLTKSAVDDFNRARSYLKNMAVEHSHPVFSSVDEALSCAAQRTHSHRRISLVSPIKEV